MVGELIEIRNRQDLIRALITARRIEEAFEEVLHWKGFLTIREERASKLLTTLVRESETHSRLVDSLIRLIDPMALSSQERKSAPIVIDGDDETQFLRKLLEGEDTAYYVYSAILGALDHLDWQQVGGEKNAAQFRRLLGQLVSAERRHRELVSELLSTRSGQ